MNYWYIFWIALPFVIGLIVLIFLFLKKRMNAKMDEQKAMIQQHKMNANIFVIEKKRDRLSNANMPKQVTDQMPKFLKFKKMPLVTAKVGPQVVTLVCDEEIYKKVPERKNINVDIAGIYIAEVKSSSQKSSTPRKSKKKKRK